MDLRITTTSALLDIRRIPGKLEIQQPKADMELNIEHPRLEMQTEHGQVVIDQRQCFAEAGLKDIFQLTTENRDFAQQKLMQSLERIVRQGNEMSSIHSGYDPIPSQAEENAYAWDDVEVNIGLIPMSRPKIDFTGGTVDITIREGRINLEVKVNKPIIDFIPGKIEHYLKQKNSINVEYVGNKLNVTG
ncbi:MAG: hypothetical protein K0R93_1486 [Anaerosolibacter sp.]|jgi:hypothetical protein|uniref:DUF6470 family protein n=1 Tax=Anaerosolibacter sp. TaxID=1872527 RepID=UPI002633F10A|nr:DUF6470 family protein [Anaerosolibacter sp.]MDF2546588.1 hypothetical protein [Anaerosolibacter sp.]